jgi:hypothetical protein
MVAFHTLAGQSAQVRTFNCSLSRKPASVKCKRTFVMRGCGPGEIRTHVPAWSEMNSTRHAHDAVGSTVRTP